MGLTHPPGRSAFTLVEVVMSMAIMAVLMAGIASAMLMAGQTLPDADDTSVAVASGSQAVDQIAGDLYCATSFTRRAANEVEFTVADRSGDAAPELIRYAWSGTPGDPLTRQYNGAAAVNLVEKVDVFDLAYAVSTATQMVTKENTTDSGEVLLGFFDGWPGIPPDPTPSEAWLAEYFVADIPDGAEKLTIARVMLYMEQGTPDGGSKSVAIHLPAVAGNPEPAASPLGTPVVVANDSLPSPGMWIPFYFSDVAIENPGKEYCVVVTGTSGGTAVLYNDNKAPADSTVGLWSTDDGASWDPASSKRNQNDVLFYVYGSYTTTSTEEVEASRGFITGVNIQLRVGSEPSSGVETAVQILNTPEVTAP